MKSALTKNPRGFTLIELMIAVALVAILLTIGLPSFQTMTKNSQRTAQMGAFIKALNVARSEASKRGMDVVICKSSNGTACEAGAVNWHDGWLVHGDLNGDGNLDLDERFALQDALEGSATLVPDTAGTVAITFSSTGDSSEVENFTFCDSRGAVEARQISIGVTGRIKTSDGGGSLSC